MIATILVIFIVSFIIVHHIYKLKDELDEIKEIVSRTEIKNQYNMEEKVYTEKDLVDFGNYLLSEQRNKTIESEEMKSVVGDWDLANWSENN